MIFLNLFFVFSFIFAAAAYLSKLLYFWHEIAEHFSFEKEDSGGFEAELEGFAHLFELYWIWT